MNVLQMALVSDSRLETFHFYQGYQFISAGYVAKLQPEGIRISCSGSSR